MKEFWMVLGLFCFLPTTQESFATELTYSLTENNLKASTDIHDNLGTLDMGFSRGLNLTQWASLLQRTNFSPSRTIIASNNKAIEVSTAINEPIMPSLSSTLFVAHTRTNEIVSNILSRNVLPEKLATKHSVPSVFFRATEHNSAISSKAYVRKPEIVLSTSEFSGIILPSWSVDKKYLSTSQAGDNSNGYSSQGAFAESAFSNGLNSQTGQLSSSNSILRRISVDYNVSASTNDDSRLFTKGSTSLVKLPRTVLLSSQTIWKTTDLNPRTLSQTTPLFSDKAGTSRSGATEKSDTNPSTLITTREFSSISRMSLATSLAKMTQDKSDVTLATFLSSRTVTTTETRKLASSLVHSDIQKSNSVVSSVVMASPSLSGKARVLSSLSPSAAMTVQITSHQGVSSSVNSKLSSRPENEFRTLTNSDERENSSDMSLTTMHSPRISALDFATRDSVSISQGESALSVPQGMRSSSHISPPVERTTRLAVSSLRTQSLHLTTSEVNLDMSLADSANTFVSRTSSNVSPSSQASFKDKNMKSSLKAEDTTKFLTQSMVQSTNWIPFSASQEFSSLNTDKNRGTRISGSSSLPEKRSSPVSDAQSLKPSSSTLLDKDKSVQTSSTVSTSYPQSDVTSGVIISLQEESATPHRAPSPQVGATINPTQTISSLSTVSGYVSSGTPTTTTSNSSHIKLPGTASSVIQSAIQWETSLLSSVVMASPSISSKARETSSQFSGAMTTIATPFIIQPPFASWTNSKFSSRTESESQSSESSRNAKNSFLMSLTYSSRDSSSISLDDGTILAKRSSNLAISTVLTESLRMTFADSTKTFSSRTSVKVRISIQATEKITSLSSSSTRPETMTELLSKSSTKPTKWIPFSTSDTYSSLNTDSYNQKWSSSTARFSGHAIRSSSESESLDMTSKLAVSSASYPHTSSLLPYKEVSAATATRFILTRSSPRMSSRAMPQKRSSTVSEDRNFSISMSFSATTLLDKSKSQTSTAVPAKSTKSEITSAVIVPVLDGSATSYKPSTSTTHLGATVLPTQTRSTSATVAGNISTGPPTTVATDTGHFNLLIVVAIIPSIMLCAFFVAVLFFRRSRKRRNKAVYSIKLEYADENNGFRKRCVNSRLDLSLKGIHIDLEFPNASSDRERRASYARDSPRYSRGSTLSETQMRELQILSQECRENMEWISEVIAREMEASICGRVQPVNRESVYSVKEKENYEPSEKVIRRESSKRGRESVKWRVPVVQRRDSDDFDQRDSMCTDDTTIYPEDWKEGHERSTFHNGAETQRKSNKKPNSAVKETGDEVKSDKELRAQLSNKKLDKLQSQDNEKKEYELQENVPLSVNLNTKKEDLSHATQGKRLSPRPQRSETL